MKTRHLFTLPTVAAAAVLATALFVAPNTARAITFADGGVHTIDASNSYPYDTVSVMDGPGGAVTTVNLLTGGEVGTDSYGYLLLYGSSIAYMSGGTVGNQFTAFDSGRISMSGGFAEGVFILGQSTGEITGGSAWTGVHVRDSASATITGGDWAAMGTANDVGGSSTVTIAGGQFGRFIFTGTSNTVVYGGSFQGRVESAMQAGVDIRGGTFSSGASLLVQTDSTITVRGSNFNYPPGDIAAVSGTLTGTLADGHAISIGFGRASTARINLVFEFVVDTDGDGVGDSVDNCPLLSNPAQVDTDANGVGDACNDGEDGDGDEFADALDNCPAAFNPAQEDSDGDLIGDLCDPFPNDPDNEQAQCEADLAACNANNCGQCEDSLVTCIADLGTCDNELGACSSDRAVCGNDLAVTEMYLVQCEDDLNSCLTNGAIPDNDGDGEQDLTDACPDTLNGEPVDDAGCSQAEFCAKVDVAIRENRRACRKSDWMNDEPAVGNPRDCEIDKGVERGSADDTCVPYVE